MAEKENRNTELYDALKSVPKEAKEAFNNGKFTGTSINPMWRIKRLTEVFGACGLGWWFKVTHRDIQDNGQGEYTAFVSVELYYKWNGVTSQPVIGEGGNTFVAFQKKWSAFQTCDDAYKCALTDALSNAAKYIGCGAEIWSKEDEKFSKQDKLRQDFESAVGQINACKTAQQTVNLAKNNPLWSNNEEIKKVLHEVYNRLNTAEIAEREKLKKQAEANNQNKNQSK